MAKTSVLLNASVDDAWPQLQQLATWEGVAGIGDLNSARYGDNGDLSSFRFVMDTPVGNVNGSAAVEARKPVMTITANEKGLRITIQVGLRADTTPVGDTNDTNSVADVETSVKSTSLLSKPLERTLSALLASSIDDEANKIARRITPT